ADAPWCARSWLRGVFEILPYVRIRLGANACKPTSRRRMNTRVASWASRARQRCNRAREERRDRAHPEFVGQKRIERRSDRKRVAHEHRIGPLGFEQARGS